MATLVDELENDFAASGSEDEGSQQGSADGEAQDVNAGLNGGEVDMEDAESNGDNQLQDEEMLDESGRPIEAEEEKEARLQAPKKQNPTGQDLHGVSSFMKSMEPILEVSPQSLSYLLEYRLRAFRNRPNLCSLQKQSIAHYQSAPSPQHTAVNSTTQPEHDPQYKLLTQSNIFSTSIDDQAAEVHKYIRDHYSARFPELETLLPDPMEYTKTVAVIGNGPMDNVRSISTSTSNPTNQPLSSILTRPKLMTVTVEATTTKGQPVPASELSSILSACKTMLRLESAKRTLTDYVQSRMNLFAPNLTQLIGSHTAAQLLNARGGLTALAETRASNLPSIGSKRPAHAGFATNVGVRNQGFLYDSITVQRIRPDLRTQAMRIVGAKVVLAARVDRVHSSIDGAEGQRLREECEKRLDKLTEPPPNKGQKALPAPDDKPSKKRGGRRARKAKEATAMTDLRKAQNRMAFGREEAETGYGTGEGTKGMGMIGQSDEGRVRALKVDQRTRAKLSKKNPGWGVSGGGGMASTMGGGTASSLRGVGQGASAGNASVLKGHGLKTSGLATSMGSGAGTASSLAFTPKQGLELVDPKAKAEMDRKNRVEEDKYFKGGTFTQVGGGTSMVNGASKHDSGGFKIPPLPGKRKREAGEN